MIRIENLTLTPGYSMEDICLAAAKELHIPRAQIRSAVIRRQSIDARKKPKIRMILTVDVETDAEKKLLARRQKNGFCRAEDIRYRIPASGSEELPMRPVIAGSGPAGLFCGLLLARAGYQPIILERGQDMDARTRAVDTFWKTGELDCECNVQFGEGGAGTFSDGKLNTMVKDREGRARFVLETFVGAGAKEDILYVNKPHIGTDVLRTVIKNIRGEIEARGGEVRFGQKVTDLHIKDGHLAGISINDTERMDCRVLVLAIGHSARDTFSMLAQKPLRMEPKPFAVGLRIEHPQEMIDRAQYGEGHAVLPPADYKLTAKLPDGRGVYSFCMCPGGYVVNASSEEGMLAVNGMSYQARDGRNANSAIVVTVTPQDFGSADVLSGVDFQRRLEKLAFRAGGGKIPVQLFGDFCSGKKSSAFGDILPCTKGSYAFADLRGALPDFLGDSLEAGIRLFDRKIQGFARFDAVFSGVESRTSSPVRIVRDDLRMSDIAGVYPCGEGAGYAGGITSAAMDGMKTAEAIIAKYKQKDY